MSAGLTAVHMHVLSARYALVECGATLAEEKFKRVKLSNPKIKAALVDVPGAVDALLAIGWIREQEPEEALVVPKGRHFTMADVSVPLL